MPRGLHRRNFRGENPDSLRDLLGSLYAGCRGGPASRRVAHGQQRAGLTLRADAAAGRYYAGEKTRRAKSHAGLPARRAQADRRSAIAVNPADLKCGGGLVSGIGG